MRGLSTDVGNTSTNTNTNSENRFSLNRKYPLAKLATNLFWRSVVVTKYVYFLRLYLSRYEGLFDWWTKRASIAMYHDTLTSTPAYMNHMAKSQSKPNYWNDIEETNKDNYIKPNSLPDLMRYGLIPYKGQIDTSSGTTSGVPTLWVRDVIESDVPNRLMECMKYLLFKNDPVICINTYGTAVWGTGILASKAMGEISLSYITGPDIGKVYDILKEFKRTGLNRPIIVFGLPTMMKYIVDNSLSYNINLGEFDLHAVVGGEAFSESMRDNIIDGGFRRCFSCYGATDLDITLGVETPFEISLRKLCIENHNVRTELFGPNVEVPMIFNYDPLNYFVEEDLNTNELLYTCLRRDKASPRIRYNLKDVGKLLKTSDVLKVLKKHNITNIKPLTHLPLICIWGRTNYGVSYHGTNISIIELEKAISRDPYLSKMIKQYGICVCEDEHNKKHFVYLTEMSMQNTDMNEHELLEKINTGMKSVSQDYAAMVEGGKMYDAFNQPTIKIYSQGQSPMSLYSMKYPNSKTKRVFSSLD
ncbi:MAG: hypothetical protein Homavirus6_1 [Homavirus sp.]|uniref:Uncharacterized protein n=1 Tax=Homavirus sp. TaxID=2487769 RepID=A0A3G5A4C4_9VIRU|nr:MAG: hypothetical protein Homavirus6_1 [Homavirus sp.]